MQRIINMPVTQVYYCMLAVRLCEFSCNQLTKWRQGQKWWSSTTDLIVETQMTHARQVNGQKAS